MKTSILRILLSYVVFASSWILLSDWLLGAVFVDPALVTQWSMCKGLVFVLVTALLLYSLLRRELGARQRAEEIVRHNQTLLSAVTEGTSDAVFVKDAQGRYLIINTAALRMTGKTREEVLGRDDTALFPVEEARRLMAADRQIMELGVVETHEERLSLGGQSAFFHTTKGPVRDAQARVIGLFGIARDITARKQGEAARVMLQAQLLQAQKLESLGRLAGGVAHDFNNQLQAIMGFAELLHADLHANQLESLQEIERAAKRAAGLTRQLLAFGRKQMFTPRVLNVNEIVTGAQKMLHRLLGEDILIDAQLSLHLKAIHADPGQIEQVIVNLAVNARDAMPEGGRLTISTSGVILDARGTQADPEARPGEFVRLSVSDTGSGISKTIQDQIFEPFFTTKGLGKGTGLGLAVIYGIVKQHNGWIQVESQTGQGTTFKIYLPVYDGVETVESIPMVAAPDHDQGHGERILLVEDEPGVRNIAICVLQRAGYDVVAAANASEARAAVELHGGHFDLIFSDVVLPDLNGILLAEELLVRQPGLPILLCSGYTDELPCASAIEGKGFGFIGKPYPAATLLSTIRQILDTHAPRVQP